MDKPMLKIHPSLIEAHVSIYVSYKYDLIQSHHIIIASSYFFFNKFFINREFVLGFDKNMLKWMESR